MVEADNVLRRLGVARCQGDHNVLVDILRDKFSRGTVNVMLYCCVGSGYITLYRDETIDRLSRETIYSEEKILAVLCGLRMVHILQYIRFGLLKLGLIYV